MGLSREQIKMLLALPQKTRGGRKPKDFIDTSIRDSQTWFKLSHKLYDEDSPDGMPQCANPNCSDPRPKTKRAMVAKVNGQLMCRYCFLEGWLMIAEGQGELDGE